jgi:hypothetical protein
MCTARINSTAWHATQRSSKLRLENDAMATTQHKAAVSLVARETSENYIVQNTVQVL